MDDWNAVAEFTGCGKIHGNQGPAPTIEEMLEAFTENFRRRLPPDDTDLHECSAYGMLYNVVFRLEQYERANAKLTSLLIQAALELHKCKTEQKP